jgi:hypothetical protein
MTWILTLFSGRRTAVEYQDFELQIGPQSGEGILVRVLRSPAGEAETILEIPERELLRASIPDRDLSAGGMEAPSDAEIGGKLFRAVFRGEVGDLFLQSLSQAGSEGQGLRIRLRINPRDRSLASLQRLPWELLYRTETEDFLALSRRTPIIRALDVPRSVAPPRAEPPLRILIVTGQQSPHDALDLAGELAGLSTALLANPAIELEVLEQADSGALRRVLVQQPFHVLHYMGHGVFEPATGEGALLLSGAEGFAESVTGRHLATKIKDSPSLRLVVLNACSTALAGSARAANPFGGVATALVLGGVSAVVAMQSPIADHHAVAFSAAFYHRLARGMTLEEAVTEGRQAIHSLRPEGAEWAIPILFQRNATGSLMPLAAEPVALPARASRRLRLRIVAGAGAALIMAALAELPRFIKRNSDTPQITPVVSVQAEREGPSQALRKPASVPSPKAPGKKVSQTSAAIATGALRVEIAGKPSAGLADAVRLAARTITGPGWTLRLNVEAPRTSPYTESGLSWTACSLRATASAEGHGTSTDLGPIAVTRLKAEDGAACADAGDELAKETIQRLQRFLKEGSK